jgi:hypothetical protein
MTKERKISILDNGNLEMFIPALFSKRDGKIVIITPEEYVEEEEDDDMVPKTGLARQLVRAHVWLELLESGTHPNVLELARELGIDESYVGRILRLVNLAPDIQESVINGTEPASLSFNKLRSAIPDDWQEQRMRFANES